jgi:hypothetical protein
VQNEDEAEFARQAKRRADAKLESRLRRLGLLDPDDDIAEAVCAPRAALIAYEADPAAECRVSALDRGCCCCFSSRRVYFLHAKVIIGLERVWRVECWGTDLSVVFSAGEELTAICLQADGIATVEQVADFAPACWHSATGRWQSCRRMRGGSSARGRRIWNGAGSWRPRWRSLSRNRSPGSAPGCGPCCWAT